MELAPQYRYAVMQNVNGQEKQVGTLLAPNFYSANKRALMLFSRHVWVERLSTHPAQNPALG